MQWPVQNGQTDKQSSTKHDTEYNRLSNTNPPQICTFLFLFFFFFFFLLFRYCNVLDIYILCIRLVNGYIMTKTNYIIITDRILPNTRQKFVRIYSLVCMILLQKLSCNGEKDTQLINPEDYTFMFLVKYNKSLGYSFLIVSSVFSNFYFLYHLEWLDWGQTVLWWGDKSTDRLLLHLASPRNPTKCVGLVQSRLHNYHIEI